ncbi:MAG TPA: tetratricopeptide repeat protein [Gemmatimonadales bacterium]|nr:tetratricopeptide repeat protein [Gemmatimonadales bacterium]
MPHAFPRCVWLTVWGTVLILSGCDRTRSDGARESGAVNAEDTGRGAEKAGAKGKVPVTSESAEARALYDQGLALLDQLRFLDARQKFQQAAAKDPGFAMAHYQLALSSPSSKDALEHIRHAVRLSGTVSEGERLAILGLEAGFNADRAKSLQYAKEAVERYPEDERARANLGFVYSTQQEYDKAVEELKKAIELNPAFSPAYNTLGYAYRPLNKNDEAEAAFKKYIELVPNDPNPYDSYAELLMKTGRFDESIAQYRKALSIDPHFTNSHYGIASNLMFQDKHPQAIAEAQKVADGAREDSDRRFALFIKSVVYADQGKTDLALKEIEKQYALDSKTGDPSQMAADASTIGIVLVHAGKPDQARKRFQQALDLQVSSNLSPESKDDAKLAHHYYLGRVALAKNDLATAKSEAAEYLKGAQAKQNDLRVRQAHELIGTIALNEKKHDEAIDELGQADQQDPYVVYLTALATQGKGDQAEARALFRQAAESYTLPTMNYALIRAKARKQAA